jgi:hypothetical protein
MDNFSYLSQDYVYFDIYTSRYALQLVHNFEI